MEIGDKVVRRSYGKDIIFTIIDIYDEDGKRKYLLKGLNIRIEADSDEDDLELSNNGEKDKVFNKKVNTTLKKVLLARNGNAATFRYPEIDIERRDKKNSSLKKNELFFGRPGKILHIDGDPVYLEICLKTYSS